MAPRVESNSTLEVSNFPTASLAVTLISETGPAVAFDDIFSLESFRVRPYAGKTMPFVSLR